MIALGERLLAGEGLATLRHPPLVPAAVALLARASGPDPLAQFAAVKLLALLSAGAMAWGVRSLTEAATGDAPAARLAFLLALLNPLTLYQVLWGGLAQFWGMAFATLALASALRAFDHARAPWRCAAWSVLTLYTHWYTAAFLAASLPVLVAAVWRSRAPAGASLRSLLLPGLAGAALAVPAAWSYLATRAAIRPPDEAVALLSVSYLPGFASAAAARPVVTAGVLALLALACLRWAMRDPPATAPRRALAAHAAGSAAGFVALLALTPESLAGRAYHFLPLLLVPLLAANLSHAREPRPRKRWIGIAAATAGVILAVAVLGHYAADASFFGPMGEPSLRAFEALADPDGGRVAVMSPFANVDGWWLEAVARRPSAPSDPARFYLLDEELRHADAVRRAAAGEWILPAGAVEVALSPRSHAPYDYSVLVRRGGDLVTVAAVAESRSRLLLPDGESLRFVGGDEALLSGTPTGARVEWGAPSGHRLARETSIEPGGVRIRYEISGGEIPPDARLRLLLHAGLNATLAIEGPDLLHHWTPGDRSSRIGLDGAQEVRSVAQDAVEIEVPVSGRTASFLLRTPATPTVPPDAAVATEAILAREGIDAVYLRGMPDRVVDRYGSDPAFRLRFAEGDVRVFEARRE